MSKTDQVPAAENLPGRVKRIEEKLAYIEHDFEKLDASIRELFEHVAGMRRLLNTVHEEVRTHGRKLGEDAEQGNTD